MTRPAADATVTTILAAQTGTCPDDWFLVFKARYGMQVVFSELATHSGGGTVVTQAFTCATAVAPIVAAGLNVRYADIGRQSIAIDAARFRAPGGMVALVDQHTFGIVDDANSAALAATARAAGAILVEDSAHCAGTMARDDDGAVLADISIHSFGAEKLLPVRFGGAVWVNPAMRDAALRKRIVAAFTALPAVSGRLDIVSRSYRHQLRVLNRLPAGINAKARRALERAKLFEPPIAASELSAVMAHPPMRPSAWMSGAMAEALAAGASVREHRVLIGDLYRRELASGIELAGGQGLPLVRFPVFAPDHATAERLFDAAAAAGLMPGRWYRPSLFPGVTSEALFGLRDDDPGLAVTRDLTSRVVNLSTKVTPAQAAAAARIANDILAR